MCLVSGDVGIFKEVAGACVCDVVSDAFRKRLRRVSGSLDVASLSNVYGFEDEAAVACDDLFA